MIEIRREQPGDIAAIARIVEQAFGSSDEANLVKMLRDRNKAVVSLVAIYDGEVVGHIMFSQVTIDPPREGFKGIGLAPVAVSPEHENKWIGSKLIRKGLEECKQAGYDIAVVLGDHRYYTRFGFSRASDYGLENEYGAGEHFTAMELSQGALEGVSGLVKYQPEFKESNT
ncbi:MAG: N-acetyltransferase [SAR202 cluster bacterium]|nr:N-acetyltransferase [SAR202 cluster bacterium]MDP6511741.1 N-acetyltransferase [SAR202 cluster bacterium]